MPRPRRVRCVWCKPRKTVLPQLDPPRNRVEKQVFPACLLGHFYRAHEGTAMKQDGKEFSPANDAMLQQAADGELVLWVFTRRHTAKLCAFPWAVAPTQATRSCAAGLVPTMPELANDMLGFPGTTLKNYLATDPTDCLESHPWKDHYWVLDEPQAVTREQVYFQQPARKAAPVVAEGASGGTVTVWTPKRKDDARAMQDELRSKGNRAFAANTAAAFGVTATRLREVLNDKPKKAPAKKVKGVWDV